MTTDGSAAASQGAGTQGGQQNGTGASGGETPKTVSVEELNKVQDRAFRMEAVAKDFEKKAQELEAKLKGIDLEEYKTLKAENEKLQEERAKNNPEEREKLYASREAKLRKELGEQLSEKDKALADAQAIIKTLRVVDVAMAEITPLATPGVIKYIRMDVERLGDYRDGRVVMTDGNGVMLYSKINPGEPMGPKEWFAEQVKENPVLGVSTVVGGSVKPGAGKTSTNGATATGQSTVPANFSSLSKSEQTAFFKANPEALTNFEKTFKYG